MAKKNYVLDTNVFLTDPDVFLAFGTNDIFVPLKVLEEIDKQKKRHDLVGFNARRVVKFIESLRKKGNLSTGVRIHKGKGMLFVQGYSSNLLPKEFNIHIPDNEIIATALTVKQNQKERKTIMVSKDINMRVKSDAVGLSTEDYELEHVVDKRDELYTGFTTYLVDEQLIDNFYSGKEIFLDKEDIKLLPNQFIMLVSNSNNKKTALTRFLDYNVPLKKISDFKHGLFGVKPRNKEQVFTMELLMDPNISIVTLFGPSGTGKAQPLDADILTPTGYIKMGNIKVGDMVSTPDGNTAKVLGVFPQGEKEIYKVTFSDDTSTECCLEHLWYTETIKEKKTKNSGSTKTLKEIKNSLFENNSNKLNHSIPVTEPIEFQEKINLPIDPYLVGLSLGNKDLTEFPFLNEKELIKLEMAYKQNCDKSIPHIYKFSSIKNRIALLQGFLDMNGVLTKNKYHISYSTTSKQLLNDVKFLVESLGGVTFNFFIDKENLAYNLSISMPEKIIPFRFIKKVENYVFNIKKQPTKTFKSIESVGKKEAQCILIDHPEHLYLTNNFIVTHNTLIAIAAGLEQVLEKKIYKKMLVTKAIVPVGGKDIGFLPGKKEEKLDPWLAPIKDNLENLLGNKKQFEVFVEDGIIEMEASTYMRGRSISNTYMILEETQNMSLHELKTIITRAGENTKIILTGDIEQIDNSFLNELTNGLSNIVEKFKEQNISGHITLLKGERSKLATIASKIL